ncbi:MAG: hypothetical protein ABL973_07945 [Micropepsaceae bacterium]
MGNWEDLSIGGSLVFAVVVSMALNNVRAPELAPPAQAAERSVAELADAPASPVIAFTVTSKRLPKECKGVPATAEIDARCEALRDQTQVTIKTSHR